MNGSGSSRWLAWTGPVFGVVFFIVAFVLQGSTPGEKDSAAKVMAYYNSHHDRTMVSVFLTPLGALLIVLFFSYLASLARAHGDVSGPGPTVLVGGAVLWAGGLLLGSVADLTLVSASDHAQAQIAQTANVISNDAWIPFVAGISVTLVGAGLTLLKTKILPTWLAWVALVVGIVSVLGPGGFAGFFIGPLFMIVAGIMLAVRKEGAPIVV
jgi:hypothetical protein